MSDTSKMEGGEGMTLFNSLLILVPISVVSVIAIGKGKRLIQAIYSGFVIFIFVLVYLLIHGSSV